MIIDPVAGPLDDAPAAALNTHTRNTHTISKPHDVLSYKLLYYTILYQTILYYTILFYIIPYHTIPYHTILCNRGEWHILGTTYQTMRRRKRRARRERVTFFTILPTHGVTAAATLSHNVQREVIHVPIDYVYMYKLLYCNVHQHII